jgi:hypothetical protein
MPLNAHGEVDSKYLKQQLLASETTCAIVAVFGTTDLGSADDIGAVTGARALYRDSGRDAFLHVDAAWGGYFLCGAVPAANAESNGIGGSRRQMLSRFRSAVGKADSVTIDPHKGSFVPYPAGAILFRSDTVMSLLEDRAAVLNHDASDTSKGRRGLDGSRPGSAAVAVLSAHMSAGLNAGGLGARLHRIAQTAVELGKIATAWRDPNNVLYAVPLVDVGHEQAVGAVVGLVFNYGKHALPNRDISEMNRLNQEIFRACSRRRPSDPDPPIYVTRSELRRDVHGEAIFGSLGKRMNVREACSAERLIFLVITPIWSARFSVSPENYARWLFDNLSRSALQVAKSRSRPSSIRTAS